MTVRARRSGARVVLAAALVATAVGCRSPRAGDGTEPASAAGLPAATPSPATGDDAPEALSDVPARDPAGVAPGAGFLARFRVTEEHDPEEPPRPLPSRFVDYKTKLFLSPDRQALSEFETALRPTGGAPAVEVRTDRLVRISELAARALRNIRRYEEAATEFWSSGPSELPLREQPEWQRLLDLEQQAADAVVALSYLHVSALEFESRWTAFARQWSAAQGLTRAEHATARSLQDAVYARMSPDVDDDPTADEVFDADAVTRVVNELEAELRRQLEALQARVRDDAPAAVLAMRARLERGTDRREVTLSPYTYVDGADSSRKSERVQFPDADDLRQLQRGFEANRRLAEAIEALGEQAADPASRRAALDGALEQARGALDRIGERLADELEALRNLAEAPAGGTEAGVDPPDPGPTAEEDDAAEVDDAESGAAQPDDEAAAEPDVAAAVDGVRTAADALLRTVRDRVERLRAFLEDASSADVPTLLERAAELREGFDTTELVEHWDALRAAFDAVPDAAPRTTRDAIDRARGILEQELESLRDGLQDLPATSAIGDLFAALGELRAIARSRSFGDLEVGEVKRWRFELEAAPDGLIDLARTPAEPGDRLVLTYALSVDRDDAAPDPEAERPDGREGRLGDGAGEESPAPDVLRFERSAELEVRKFGWYTTYSAQLVFYSDLHGRSGSFQAAPAVAINLHHRPDWAYEFFDVFAPAVGVAVIAPSLEDGTELAVGAQVTLLNDFLQVGWAYDISVDDDPWMFYFGLDLISAFQMVE